MDRGVLEGQFEVKSDAWVEGLLGSDDLQNEMISVVHMSGYSANRQAAAVFGSPVPEPSTFVVILGSLILLRRLLRRPQVTPQ